MLGRCLYVTFSFLFFQHPELFRWFKDFVGFKEGTSQPEPVPSPLPQPRQERVTGDAAMEIGQLRVIAWPFRLHSCHPSALVWDELFILFDHTASGGRFCCAKAKFLYLMSLFCGEQMGRGRGKIVLLSSCNGVPLNSEGKTGGLQVYQHGLFQLSVDPS